jgi:hypothetical protein
MLRLTAEEQGMLEGKQGVPTRKAMEILVALGQIYGAEELTPVTHVQIAGVSYKNLGEAGLAFLREWAKQGARVRVPATLNPAGMDMENWRALGIPESFALRQAQVVEAYAAMGVERTLTCTPYLVGYRPALGEHLAWSESSAVSFANSVLGARSNREGGPSALAAAITGRTPCCGLHLESARVANWLIEVRCSLRREIDFGALGYWVGKRVRNGVPYFRFLGEMPEWRNQETRERSLKMLGAAMAASGAVALYHIEGVTPEAGQAGMFSTQAESWTIDNLDEAFAALNHPGESDAVDFVSIGCPHASLEEIAAVAERVRDKTLRARLWVTTSRQMRLEAEKQGYVEQIERAGGFVVADTCIVVAPVELLDVHSMATNSAKAAFYAPAHSGLNVRLGTLEQCIHAALAGRWLN